MSDERTRVERNKAVVTAFIDAWNRVDWEAVFGMMTDDVVYHNIPWEPVAGLPAVRENMASFGVTASAWVVHHIVGEGDLVMTERTDRVEMGGKWITLRVMGVFELRDGRIAAWRDYFDPAEIGV